MPPEAQEERSDEAISRSLKETWDCLASLAITSLASKGQGFAANIYVKGPNTGKGYLKKGKKKDEKGRG